MTLYVPNLAFYSCVQFLFCIEVAFGLFGWCLGAIFLQGFLVRLSFIHLIILIMKRGKDRNVWSFVVFTSTNILQYMWSHLQPKNEQTEWFSSFIQKIPCILCLTNCVCVFHWKSFSHYLYLYCAIWSIILLAVCFQLKLRWNFRNGMASKVLLHFMNPNLNHLL